MAHPGINRFTRIFGTKDWEPAFYPKKEEDTLFGREESVSPNLRDSYDPSDGAASRIITSWFLRSP